VGTDDQLKDYACWRAALAGHSVENFERHPHCGFWRKGKSGDPVAVWRDAASGNLVARIGGRQARWADAEFDETTFGFCLPNPISHETYQAVMRGEPWPGTDAVVAAQIGDNSGAVDDVEMLRDQIAAAVEQAKTYRAVEDDETAAKAQSLRARLLELAGEVAKKHKSEKEPHLTAGREVDAKWLPMARSAENAAAPIRNALSAYETAKMLAARKAADEERQRTAETGEAPAAPQPTAKPAPIRGGHGRAAGVRTIRVAIIIDQDEVYRTFRENAEVCALLKKLAQKAIDVGASVPGVQVNEERKVA